MASNGDGRVAGRLEWNGGEMAFCAEEGEGGRERERLLVRIKPALATGASYAKIAGEVGLVGRCLSGHPVAKTASEFGILKT
jgi:hypothetical protein